MAAAAVNAADNGVGLFEVVGDVLDAGPDPDVEVVLAGDVCYDRAMSERVLPYLDAARLGGAAVFLGDPGRPYLPRSVWWPSPPSTSPTPKPSRGAPDDRLAAALTAAERGRPSAHARCITSWIRPRLSRIGNDGYGGCRSGRATQTGGAPDADSPEGEPGPPQYRGEFFLRALGPPPRQSSAAAARRRLAPPICRALSLWSSCTS